MNTIQMRKEHQKTREQKRQALERVAELEALIAKDITPLRTRVKELEAELAERTKNANVFKKGLQDLNAIWQAEVSEHRYTQDDLKQMTTWRNEALDDLTRERADAEFWCKLANELGADLSGHSQADLLILRARAEDAGKLTLAAYISEHIVLDPYNVPDPVIPVQNQNDDACPKGPNVECAGCGDCEGAVAEELAEEDVCSKKPNTACAGHGECIEAGECVGCNTYVFVDGIRADIQDQFSNNPVVPF